MVRVGGTDLGAALEAALEALPGDRGDHEAIVLITDGEDLHGRGLAVAERCRDRGVRVHCLGLGTERGSKIALADPTGTAAESFLRDRRGDEVVSALDLDGLQRIAAATGGHALSGNEPRTLLDLYERSIQPMARKSFAAEERTSRRNRFQWPLLVALLLWILDLCFTDRSRDESGAAGVAGDPPRS
jgi:Ca-activated chloride channel family protein